MLAVLLTLGVALSAPASTPVHRGNEHAEIAVRAPTPYLRYLEHKCDVQRDSYGPEFAAVIGDFTGAISSEPARGRRYRHATSFLLGYLSPMSDNSCHIIARGRRILHGPHFRIGKGVPYPA